MLPPISFAAFYKKIYSYMFSCTYKEKKDYGKGQSVDY